MKLAYEWRVTGCVYVTGSTHVHKRTTGCLLVIVYWATPMNEDGVSSHK